jgi:hypothetical protein
LLFCCCLESLNHTHTVSSVLIIQCAGNMMLHQQLYKVSIKYKIDAWTPQVLTWFIHHSPWMKRIAGESVQPRKYMFQHHNVSPAERVHANLAVAHPKL